jgi:ATP-binding cassette, subfamily B, bacterial
MRFEEVLFSYPNERCRPVLVGLCLTLRPGERLALVGANGAGKTTFVKLLAGLYRPTAGRITVGGVDLADLEPVQWRSLVSVVFQNFVRYPGTLAENVAAGAGEHPLDVPAVRTALLRAGADGLLSGTDRDLTTSLWKGGTKGVDLSGGQWQSIAIARAIYAAMHGRRVLVFDEPTANLDVAAESAFHGRLLAATATTATTLLISHRLSTVRPASRILLLNAGRVVEDGSHDELMARDAEYSRLFRLQAARFGQEAR